METFMIEYFAYRTLLEKSLVLGKTLESLSTYWRIKGMADKEIKSALPTFKELGKKINKDPSGWDRHISHFKARFISTYYPTLFEEEYGRQLKKISGGGEDICDFMEREAHKATIIVLEKQAMEDVKPNFHN